MYKVLCNLILIYIIGAIFESDCIRRRYIRHTRFVSFLYTSLYTTLEKNICNIFPDFFFRFLYIF